MVSFTTIVGCYESGKHAEPIFQDVSRAISKVNSLLKQMAFRAKLVEKLSGDMSDAFVEEFKKDMMRERGTMRLSLDDFKSTKVYKDKLYCYYNVRHGRFFCYEKEYAGNKNWILCGWADKEEQHVKKLALAKARDAYARKIQKEIETKTGELRFAEMELTTAMQAALDGDWKTDGNSEAA